jgi:hypothetical protein
MEHLFLSNVNMTAFPSSFGFTRLTGELMVPNEAGVVLQSGHVFQELRQQLQTMAVREQPPIKFNSTITELSLQHLM